MKVLMIGSDRTLFRANSAARLRLSRYSSLGKEVHVIVFAKGELGLRPEQIAKNVWIYPTNSKNRFKYMKDAYRRAQSILDQSSQWVVSTQDPFEAGIVGRKLKKQFGVKLHVQIHTDFLSPYFKKGILNRIRLFIAPKVLRAADGVRVVSKRIGESIVKKYGVLEKRITVLPIHVNVSDAVMRNNGSIRGQYTEFDTIVLMLSRLTPEKDIMAGVKAFKSVVEKYSRAGLVIVGEGSEKAALIDEAKRQGVENNVRFETWSENVHEYYHMCDIFLLTSQFEGFGMTIVEAAAHGKAIVATDVGIAQEFENHKEIKVCPVGDVKCIGDSINTLIDDPVLQKQFGINIKQAVTDRFNQDFESYTAAYARSLNSVFES